MATRKCSRYFGVSNGMACIFAFVVVVVVVAKPMYSVLSSSVPASDASQAQPEINAPNPAAVSNAPKPISNFARSRTFALEPAPLAQTIATYSSDCVTPQTDFNLGDVVCVKATGVPSTIFTWHVGWVDQAGFVREFDNAVADDSTSYTYLLPSSATSVVNDQTVNNVGNWRVTLLRFSGQIQQTIEFTVHEPSNPTADIFVQKFVRDINASVPSGNNIPFTIVLQNDGPDRAANVHLVDAAPSGFGIVSFTQQSGPPCSPANAGDCTITSMAHGERAEFSAIYGSGANPQGTYSTSSTVSADTPDLNTDNNTATVQFLVTSPAPSGTCDITCPSDITVNANTTEAGVRGAHVTYTEPAGTGTCGSISSTPASGGFFPVGTTVVSASSETGGGSCQFTITVEESSGNVSVSCPQNVAVNADADCHANVAIGIPTTTGDNVTLYATRSDGEPVYDCDANGNCVRRSSDALFSAGTTTITWFAYSHDIAGPFTTSGSNPGDTLEEQHRTGTASCTQMIIVVDVTPPMINAPNTSASADDSCLAPVPDYTTLTSVSDNCACTSSDTSQICDTRQDIVVTQSPAAGTLVGLGPHTITLSANDGSSNNGGAGNTTTIQVTFTVNDTTPPVITAPPPVIAYTGAGATTCDTVISDAVLGTATATDNCGPITITRSPSGNTFPVGDMIVSWTATDGAGNSSSAEQTVRVIDNTSPTITVNGNVPSMWPPNHKYQTFSVTSFIASVFDNCGGVNISDVVIRSVTSDETENGNGDGNTTNDIIIASDCRSVQLRAERDGGGDGRVYTISFRLTDTHGNVTTAMANVVVEHNPGETPVNSGVHYTVNSACP